MSHYHLFLSLKQAVALDETDEARLVEMAGREAVISGRSFLDTLRQALPDPAKFKTAERLLAPWLEEQSLAPTLDELYAQRRWLAGLLCLQAGVAPDKLAAAWTNAYREPAQQLKHMLAPDTQSLYLDTLLKSLNLDLSFSAQCYSLNQKVATGPARAATEEIQQAFAQLPTFGNY